MYNIVYIVYLIYNAICEFRSNCKKTLGRLWQYHKDYPNDVITYSESFKARITRRTPAGDNIEEVQITVLLKYLRFGEQLERGYLTAK